MSTSISNDFSIAIVIHAFYIEQFVTIVEMVKKVYDDNRLNIDIDIHITLSEASDPRIKNYIDSDRYLNKAIIHSFPNYGMDLLPFFQIMPSLQKYDWVLKLHTKNCHDSFSRVWFESLCNGLIATPEIFFETLNYIRSNHNWNMAGLMPFFVSSKHLMFNNELDVEKLAKLWDVSIEDDWGFFAGSFFWLRPRCYLEASEKLLDNKTWFTNAFAKDGQMAHAVERVLTRVAQKSGEVGLILPSFNKEGLCDAPLFYSDKHPMAINRVFTKQLIGGYKTLSNDIHVLNTVPLLDVKAYSKDTNINFIENMQAYEHFLLIGQFNGFSKSVKPIDLRVSESKILNWQIQSQKYRKETLVSIIIPVVNNFKLTIACLESIKRHSHDINYEVIVVDNGSDKIKSIGMDIYSKLNSHVRVFHLPNNLNFSIACNYGFSKSNGQTVVFLNNDTKVTKGWLPPIQKAVSQPKIIAVQPKLLYLDDTIQCAGVDFGDDGFGICRYEGYDKDNNEANISQSCPALTAACLAMKAKDFVALKGFDTWYINGQEDMDLCIRMRQAFPSQILWYEAKSSVYHYTSKTTGRKLHIDQNRAIFKAKWHHQSSLNLFKIKKAK